MNRKKSKILIIAPTTPPFHGVSVITSYILNSNIKDQFEIILLDIADRRSIENIGKFDWTNLGLALKHFFRCLCILLSKRPDIIYIYNSETFWGFLRDCLFLIPSILFHKPIVVHSEGGHFRDFYENEAPSWMKILIRWIFKNISCLIILCNRLKYNYEDLVPESQIRIFGNAVTDLTINEKPIRKNDDIQVLYLSNLIKEKGFFDVIKAIPYVISEKLDVKFVFAGEWHKQEDKHEAEEFIKTHQLENYISFRGQVCGEYKEKLLIESDIFVFPTYYPMESWGIVINEAMAASLPIITTNKACIPEIIEDGETGFIIDKQNPKQIADKILLLASNNLLREQMGQTARKRFLENYTIERFIDNLTNVFLEVM